MAKAGIQYLITMEEPHTHLFHVKLSISAYTPNDINIRMAAWTPGHYLMKEFAGNVMNEKALVKDKAVGFIKTDKHTWNVKLGKVNSFAFEYDVYAFDLSVRTSYLDEDMAMINPASIFMIPEGFEKQPLDISIEPFYKWNRITTALESYKGSYDRFVARDFDELVDSPIQAGNHDIYSFKASGVLHEYAVTSPGNYDMEEIKKDSSKVIETAHKMFGGDVPYDRYVFFLHPTDGKYGGLEHKNCSSLISDRHGFSERKDYVKFMGLVSHEYFHTYNVKRIKPAELADFDYAVENYSRNLWIAEGITSYFDDLLLLHSGVTTVQEYFDALGESIRRHHNMQGRKIQTLEESSFDAWIKFYRTHSNSRNQIVSYYTKGSLVALFLDITILHSTKGKKGLKDVMLALWQNYKQNKSGFTTDEFKTVCEETAGMKLAKIWKYLDTTEEMDFAGVFKKVGLNLIGDFKNKKEKKQANFGFTIDKQKMQVKVVKSEGPSYHNGIYSGDEVIALSGHRLNAGNWEKRLADCDIGKPAELTISREGILRIVTITPIQQTPTKYTLSQDKKQAAAAKILYNNWLNTEWVFKDKDDS